MNHMFDGKRILVTGGTGSIGRALVEKIVSEDYGVPKTLWIFSRDESKQFVMRKDFPQPYINFLIGDIRDYGSVVNALVHIDMVFHMAAMKHVPACEQNPREAVVTNVLGASNIVGAIENNRLGVDVVVGCSTDKCCNPVGVMGMTKAIQERIFVNANHPDGTRYLVCRFGNVAGTRGSVIPIFKEQIEKGLPVTITHGDATRFLMIPEQAATLMIEAAYWGGHGDVWVAAMNSCRIEDLALALADGKPIEMMHTGLRAGERMHEPIISREESRRTTRSGDHFVICTQENSGHIDEWEYTSNDPSCLMFITDVRALLDRAGL